MHRPIVRAFCLFCILVGGACQEFDASLESLLGTQKSPEIESVKGDSSRQPGRVATGLDIVGAGFGSRPTVTLVHQSRRFSLPITNVASDSVVHVSLPTDLRAELGQTALIGELNLVTTSQRSATMALELEWEEQAPSPAAANSVPVKGGQSTSGPSSTQVSHDKPAEAGSTAGSGDKTAEGSAGNDSLGTLPRETIQKVVARESNAIRYCYERELAHDKTLAGTIKMQLVIGSTGAVTASVVKESTMNNPHVESCIAKRLKNLAFPAPREGGTVIVNYPFVFKAHER